MKELTAAVAAACVLGCPPALAQQRTLEGSRPTPSRAEVLVLGTYHMGTAGSHVVEAKIDDVLSPRRQAEIEALVDVLKRFRPTKIAVESGFNDGGLDEDYRAYQNGTRAPTRNEIDQIGFRLAAALGHSTVHGVDVDGEFPWPRLADYAKANGRTREFDALLDELGSTAEAQGEYLRSHTVLEALLRMNSDAAVAADLGVEYRYAHFGEAWNWAGADLVAAWFHRNIRIHTNIVRLVESPEERILVIFGAGHLAWLRHNVASDPTLRLRKLSEFVE